jgi:hypothetical protein
MTRAIRAATLDRSDAKTLIKISLLLHSPAHDDLVIARSNWPHWLRV